MQDHHRQANMGGLFPFGANVLRPWFGSERTVRNGTENRAPVLENFREEADEKYGGKPEIPGEFPEQNGGSPVHLWRMGQAPARDGAHCSGVTKVCTPPAFREAVAPFVGTDRLGWNLHPARNAASGREPLPGVNVDTSCCVLQRGVDTFEQTWRARAGERPGDTDAGAARVWWKNCNSVKSAGRLRGKLPE